MIKVFVPSLTWAIWSNPLYMVSGIFMGMRTSRGGLLHWALVLSNLWRSTTYTRYPEILWVYYHSFRDLTLSKMLHIEWNISLWPISLLFLAWVCWRCYSRLMFGERSTFALMLAVSRHCFHFSRSSRTSSNPPAFVARQPTNSRCASCIVDI